MSRLKGKVAVITGGCSGIGLGAVEVFVAQGAKVMVGDIDDQAGAALAARFDGAVAYQHCDVMDERQIEGQITRILAAVMALFTASLLDAGPALLFGILTVAVAFTTLLGWFWLRRMPKGEDVEAALAAGATPEQAFVLK